MAAPHSDLYSAWYDASDAATVTADGSNLVSQWSDKSGNGHDAVQATASLKPRYSSVANGIKFDGSDDKLVMASSVTALYAFVALSQGFSGTSTNFDTAFANSTSPEASLRVQDADEYRATGGTQDINDFTNPTGRIWVNGSMTRFFSGTATSHVVTVESPSLRTVAQFGIGSTAGRGLKGWLHEAIFVNSSLTDDQIAAITEYLVGRWTLPAAAASSRPVLSSPHLIGDLR